MRARISVNDNAIHCELDDIKENADIGIELSDGVLVLLNSMTQEYKRIVHSDNQNSLKDLGSKIFAFLDKKGWASQWLKGTGNREIEIAVNEVNSNVSRTILDLPWEILTHKGIFLAEDQAQLFVVFRSIGKGKDAVPWEPKHSDIAMMFMAASPNGELELDFEAEEAAILEATARLPLQVVVEESGCVDFLKHRLAQDGPFEVVHISSHGGIFENEVPALAFETPEGELALTNSEDFTRALGEKKAPLVFISACRSAETSGKVGEMAESYVRALVGAGVPNVLGWDGSVDDGDAILFARNFYHELAKFTSVPIATAVARQNVLRSHQSDLQKGHYWHLARVYVGPCGAGACCSKTKPMRQLRIEAGYKEFLDESNNRVPVATAQEFVGRRRQAQAILRAFRDPQKAGALILGMGNLGKSSLAARIANRMPRHQTAVIYEQYDSVAIFDQLLDLIPKVERIKWKQKWRDSVEKHSIVFLAALKELLEGPFHQEPILLIIDDLEQILDLPKPGQMRTSIRDFPGAIETWRTSMAAVLRSFSSAQMDSRLLITSRFDFTLPDEKGNDLADVLVQVHLCPMEYAGRIKQWQTTLRLAQRTESKQDYQLVKRALDAAGGNPGLQEILCRPIIANEFETANSALDIVEHWKSSGDIPKEESAALEFFKRVTFETYRNALTISDISQLRATTLFSEILPIPISALEVVGQALNVDNPGKCLSRLISLGLVDFWGNIRGVKHASVNPLARSLAGEKLTDEELRLLAVAAIVSLEKVIKNNELIDGSMLLELARLSFVSKAPAKSLEKVAFDAGAFLYNHVNDYRGALSVLLPALAEIENQKSTPHPRFLLLASMCAQLTGDLALQISLLEKGLALQSNDKVTVAQIASNHATATMTRDGVEKTLNTLYNAAALFDEAGDELSRAVNMGKIADILNRRGDTKKALHIRLEEELPTYKRLGKSQALAGALGEIAHILKRMGKTEEALEMLHDAAVLFEEIGDERSRAITMDAIADILKLRGETAEALRIYLEDISIFERFGDKRSWAGVMSKIANIQENIEEALCIQREKVLPIFEALGDLRSRAVVMGSIADLLVKLGKTEEALCILREEKLPVMERLGDVREWALTMSGIADILEKTGESEEALRILLEEVLPMYEKTGDILLITDMSAKIVDVLLKKEKTEEAIRILCKEVLPVLERLDEERLIAIAMFNVANIHNNRGETDKALSVLINKALPAAERAQDIRLIAQISFSCGAIRVNRRGIKKGEMQVIINELKKSFQLNKELQLLDGIAAAGSLLGQVLSLTEHIEASLNILQESIEAYEQLGRLDICVGLRQFQNEINSRCLSLI